MLHDQSWSYKYFAAQGPERVALSSSIHCIITFNAAANLPLMAQKDSVADL